MRIINPSKPSLKVTNLTGTKLILSSESANKKLKNFQIYLYPLKNKPTRATPWEYSQIYNIEFHKSLSELNYIDCFIRQKLLFLLNEGHLTQWDLSKTTSEMFEMNRQYTVVSEVVLNIVINKGQTLLALSDGSNDIDDIDIYSMETGKRILRYR